MLNPMPFNLLRPSSTLTEAQVNRSLRLMVWDGMAGTAMFALASGGFMAAFALALGANNLQIGVLAALPYVTQVAQLPAILAVERFRRRKLMGVPCWYVSNLIWIPVGAVPFLMDTPGAGAVFALMALIGFRGLFASAWGTSWASWMSDLVPQEGLGRYYGRRLAYITGITAVISLAASFFVQWWTGAAPFGEPIHAYSFLLIGGALTLGIASPTFTALAREPLMPPAVALGRSVFSVLTDPLRDRNFSRLVRFLFVWSFASNLAIPFFAVYLLTKLGLALPAVIGFTVLSYLSNILFVRVWGPLADRVGSKTVLSMSASLYLLVIVGWTFTTLPGPHALTIPLLVMLHVFAGGASAGVTLTVGTLALKIAPEGRETPFLGVAGIATNVGIGVGPIVGGLLADFFSVRGFEVVLRWTHPDGLQEFPAFSLTGFDFLFVIAFVVGLMSLNLLITLREEGEVPRSVALTELSAGMAPVLRTVSSVPGLSTVSALSVGYLRRLPGADVALGITAYQLAASTKAAVATATRGRALTNEVARLVASEVQERMGSAEDMTQHGVALALHATRGALEAAEDLSGQAGELAQGAVRGTMHALVAHPVDETAALWGAGYGVIQGVSEANENLEEALASAIRAAREVSRDLDISEEQAVAALAAGALDAAVAEGREAMLAVQATLPDDIPQEAVDALRNLHLDPVLGLPPV